MSYKSWMFLGGLAKGVLASVTVGGIIAGGYGISTLFDEKEKTIDLTDESKILWEYVLLYDGARSCNLLHSDGKINSQDYRKINCNTDWAKKIIQDNQNKTGLWIKGNEQTIIDSFDKSELPIKEFVLEISERAPDFVIKGEEVVKRIKEKCKKINEFAEAGFEYTCEFPSLSNKR